MTALLSSLDFFATGMGVIIICVVAAAIILLWDWRFSLIGLVVVQFGVTAVALHTQRIDPNVMIIQTCVIALCTLILALSNAQAPQSPTIRQSGNWLMRLLTLILLYTALRLFDFNYTLPLPGVGSGDALRMTIFFAWLGICALLILSFSDNPLFTGVALLLWCVPIHVLAALLTPLSGIVILIGIIELLLALACSYLVLTEGFSAEPIPAIAADVTFPTKDRLLLTDGQMRPISEMATLDMPALPITPVPKAQQGRAAAARPNQPRIDQPRIDQPRIDQPRTAEHSTVLAAPRQPLTQRKSSSLHATTPDSRQPSPNQPSPDYPRPDYPRPVQSQPPQQRTTVKTPLTRDNLRAVPNYSSEPASSTRPISQNNQPPAHKAVPNQLRAGDEDQPTQPTLNVPSLADDASDRASDHHVKSKRSDTSSRSHNSRSHNSRRNNSPADADSNSSASRFFKRERKSNPNSAPDTLTPKQQDSKEEK